MPLSTGQTLSFYEILGPLGAGGMGEVYLARDTRLEREVAIKVLPEEFADDDERLRRFDREAKTLASLNHPNVAGIHGIDQVGDTCFLAMELVPGEDLEERLKRGPLPVAEAVDVCRQIAEGLEVAHEAGVVHRDLKPANVRITPEGVVKILDFGLAKPIHPKATQDGTTSAESDSFLVTEEGLVLGTPTYMSPEQARGKPVDRRTDIWAFGCVLYECLTGQRAFRGDSLTDVLAAIVGQEPDLSQLPVLPSSVRTLLLRCLEKDPRVRLRDIGEARVLLNAKDLESNEPQAPAPAKSRVALLLAGAGVLGALLGAYVVDGMSGQQQGPVEDTTAAAGPPPVLRFAQPPARDEKDEFGEWRETFLSPDGRSLAATTWSGLLLRSLDSLESTLIPNTRATAGRGVRGRVAWSPDSAHLAYIDGTTILRTTAEGRSPTPLFSISDEMTRLGSLIWLDDGRIVFSSMTAAGVLLQSIPEAGGGVTEVAVLSESMTEGHLHSLAAVPGGRFVAVRHSFLGDTFTVLTGGTPGDSELRTLFELPGESITTARWVPGNYLLFTRGTGEEADDAWAVPLSMDPLEVTGDPFFVQDGLTGASVSMNGTLAYIEPKVAKHQLAWWSTDGQAEPFGRVHDQAIKSPSFSESMGSILYLVGEAPPIQTWRYDVRRGVSTEVMTGQPIMLWAGALPDGRIAYSALDTSANGSGLRSYLLPATGRGAAEPWFEGGVLSISEEHALLAELEGDSMDLYVGDLPTLERRPFRSDRLFQANAAISPDGNWTVLVIDGNVYLTRFPSGEGEWQVSPDGGWDPRFSRDGSWIYFVSGQELNRVSFQTEPDVLLGAPDLVGRAEEGTKLTGIRDESSVRYLAMQTLGSADGNLVVVLGWASELGRR